MGIPIQQVQGKTVFMLRQGPDDPTWHHRSGLTNDGSDNDLLPDGTSLRNTNEHILRGGVFAPSY